MRFDKTDGDSSRTKKLESNQVLQIRSLYIEGVDVKCLAKKFGVHTATINNIVKRRSWKKLS